MRWAMRLALSRRLTTWRYGRSNGSLAVALSGNGRTDLTIKLPAQWAAMMVTAATDPARVRGIRKDIRRRNPGRVDHPVKSGTALSHVGSGKSQLWALRALMPMTDRRDALLVQLRGEGST